MADLLVQHRPAKSLQGQCHPCQKKKEKRCLSRVPDHEGERVKVGESHTLVRQREKGIKARAWRGKGGLHGEQRQIPRKKDRASKKSLSKRSRRNHERVSGCKSSPG